MGMIPRHISQPFYKSSAWRKCRAGYINSVGGLCERCIKKNKIVQGYMVHHKQHLNEKTIHDPTVSLSWDNLEYLCLDCHNKEHFSKEKIINDDVMVDSSGNLIPRSNQKK
ncbi:HNH endonuclease [Enterococcus faecalis]|nr:HNH endonuclease [Enterococcus faecalis]EJU8114398.1 HNH endonuclease [Enterococcus faecalis]EKI8115774.1 HNH endonuclease [Enterococcus faecalis]